MKDEKKVKPRGIKHKIREEREKEQRIALVVTVAILIIIVFLAGFLINSMLNQPSTSRVFKAAIVDHLSIAFPNQTFVEAATGILEQAGYTVVYYSGEKVTVEFYRKLPVYGYDLIILRVHSTTHDPEAGVEYTGLFTSEPFNTEKYVYERNTFQVGVVAFLPYNEGDPVYFGIASRFVRLSMVGTFEKTAIIMMGCWGLKYPDLAMAFVEKGTQVYIGWSDSVLSYHTDAGTTVLLRHLITQKQTVEQAVTETMKEIGPDPESHGVLSYYPPESGSYILPHDSSRITLIVDTMPQFRVMKKKNLERISVCQS